jgi:hypothetical protein
VYGTARIDDRISAFTSVEQLPQPGTAQVGDKRVEQTEATIHKRVDTLREQWKKANPKANQGGGPFPWLTTVTLRRNGAPVPQTLLVKFADGSSETVRWDGDEKWRRFSWTRPAKAVSAELDPKRAHYLDASKLDDSRTLDADGSASRRWSSEFAALVQLLLALIATV